MRANWKYKDKKSTSDMFHEGLFLRMVICAYPILGKVTPSTAQHHSFSILRWPSCLSLRSSPITLIVPPTHGVVARYFPRDGRWSTNSQNLSVGTCARPSGPSLWLATFHLVLQIPREGILLVVPLSVCVWLPSETVTHSSGCYYPSTKFTREVFYKPFRSLFT